ncbi:Sec-independent protein translocase protein TatA [Streptomyces sp. LBL]|uniref:hypothetical protein n=1 Tax=Streptomyces sp. LBL TaxID=2940562 RepID=UPI0024737CD1|nr:hypothetical protein [Streptomyces sp. LBL]MDH6626754.1 Sec-independent protein translocase protein TatA [Streptomyces sp. LBL]
MDEGLVALVTAGVGLVGALGGAAMGGLAAVRGARMGAETTARATIEQARTQERAQHDHWLRDERKRAAVLMLEVYDRFTIAASDVTRMFDLEIEASTDVWSAYSSCMNEIRGAYFPLRLLGPARVHQAARQLWQLIEQYHEGIKEWADGIMTATEETRAEWRAREEQQRYTLGRVHSDLIDAVSESLQGNDAVPRPN